MIMLKAIVRPNRVDAVKEALEKIGVSVLTVTEVRGHGNQKGTGEIGDGRIFVLPVIRSYKIRTGEMST